MSAPINIWAVYHVFRTDTTPPKNKFIVIVFHDLHPMGFLINSKINEFVQRKKHLLSCHVLIKQADHMFLTHDSFVDCQAVFPCEAADLTQHVGEIHADARPAVLAAVHACVVLPYKHKMAILNANTPPIRPE